MSNNSSSNARLPPPIPIFVGKYYAQWVDMMTKILIGHGLWDYVENGYDESNWKMKQDNIKNDAKALGFIKRALSPAILQRIIHAAKAKEAWDILKREFGNPKVPPPTPMRRKPHRHHIHRPAPAGSKRVSSSSLSSHLGMNLKGLTIVASGGPRG
ncbi:hypothetical protein Leryth_002712 [Lithospermum erythrorhizon]|nr:hypothetical protein Leryth_002712 [Lithospermum erythrorhizon]